MGIVVEAVGFITGFDVAGKTVDGDVHQAELGVVLHFLLAIEGHGLVGRHAGCVHEVTGLDEHTTTTAGGVEQDAALWL